MPSRLDLHNELVDILGCSNVYFQPPSSGMKYPCIKYSIGGIDQIHANDKNYRNVTRYDITVIDYDPDSEIPSKLIEHFSMCSFDRAYPADNLNHFTLTLYY